MTRGDTAATRAPGPIATVLAVTRAREWWHHKIAGILCVFYATALADGRSLATLAWQGGTLIVAIAVLAAYVSILNDVTDRHDDAVAGKRNRMAGRSAAFRTAGLALPLLAVAVLLWIWRDRPLSAALYAGAWLAFTLYSVPPFRLKARGFAGVLADGCGAHLLPSLAAASLAGGAAGAWLLAVGCWSLGYGLRGNLWHQLVDRDADRAARVGTFAASHPRATAVLIARWGALPLELGGLGAMLVQIDSVLPVLALAGYGVLCWQRWAVWRVLPIVASAAGSYRILLHDYYDAIWPVALLIGAALAHRADAIVLGLHLLLFGARPLLVARDAAGLAAARLPRLIGSR